ncbi:Cytoplasmic glyoxalase II [Teratosphaeriaceae sp. CCFEE 6253]|nr:Cytoplasmic glyoxalase II [Teratosphaeriaceae sp. CCFEE 6253]
MHIESIPMWEGTGNNYAYLVTDEKTKDAVIIDPANPSEYAALTPWLCGTADVARSAEFFRRSRKLPIAA